MTQDEFYAVTRLLEVFAPCDPYVTNLQVALFALRRRMHGDRFEVQPETAAKLDELEARYPRAAARLPQPQPKNDPVCEHGVAMDVHCCGCHSGFLFDIQSCTCLNPPSLTLGQSAIEP